MEKSKESISWVIGGPQGSGIDSAAQIFIKSIAISGLNIFGKREYYSNIKGEHSYFTVRVSDKKIRSHEDNIDILVSFDGETVVRHAPFISTGGILIYDPEILSKKIEDIHTLDFSSKKRIKQILEGNNKQINFEGILEFLSEKNVLLLKIPFFELLNDFAAKTNDHSLSKLARITNVMSLAVSLAVLNFDKGTMEKGILSVFSNKPNIAQINVQAANYAYDYVINNFRNTVEKFSSNIKFENNFNNDTIIVQGNQTSPLGKIVAGCRIQTYYPITPATDDSEYLESNQTIKQNDGEKGSVTVIQTEDEIAAVAMAIGAVLTGARSCTTTSGPGFSLMAEALGWAGINEVPLVVTMYQRAGPSTGLPTRQEQGDLLFAINAGHGEFARIVYSSGDIEESFYDTIKVFNYAELFQVPTIHLLDKYISNSIITSKIFDYKNIKIERGKLVNSIVDNKFHNESESDKYKRFKIENNDPISPRVPLGLDGGVFWNTGDEHDEYGHITEDPEIRSKMMEKRLSKIELMLNQISDTDKIRIEYEDKEKEKSKIDKLVFILSWGSTKGAILDTLEKITKEYENIQFIYIQFKLLFPFPSNIIQEILDKKTKEYLILDDGTTKQNFEKVLIDIEMNYTGQLETILKQNIQTQCDFNVLKYNGRPISQTELYDALNKIIKRNTEKRVILTNGV